MIGGMKSELTGASEINSKTDNLAVTGDENVDESITAGAKASNKMEMFKKNNASHNHLKKMIIDIENINTF